MFLKPPEELAGPQWSTKMMPGLCPTHTPLSGITSSPDFTTPGFLLQARAAVAEHPESPIALARLAQAAQSVGDPLEALGYARQAMELGLRAGAPGAVHAAMTILTTLGEAQDATPLIDDALASDVPVAVRVRAAAAAHEYDAARRLPGIEGSPDALAVIAWIKTEQRDFRGAVAAGREAEKAGAAGVTLYTNVGYAHAALGNLDKAIKSTRQALAISPTDRRIGFNLAHYMRLAGRFGQALEVLEGLKAGETLDIELALAIARALTDCGRLSDAHRTLQRARASKEWALADDVRRAELTANLALLRWITRRDKADWSLQEILRALGDCDYKSVGIANLLMNLMRTPEHAEQLARVIGRLESRHQENELLGLRLLLSILLRDPDAAVRYSVAWAQHDLFNPFAAATATMVVGELAGDFDSAAEIGLSTLRRAPTDMMLLNNTAFVLAMAGRLGRAQKLLNSARALNYSGVYLTATQGLVDMLGGQVDQGREAYQRAKAMAEAQRDGALAARVLLYAAFAERAAGGETELPSPERLIDAEETKTWRDLPGFWIATERLRRERAVSRAASGISRMS